jgi:hypothetical protein
VTTTKATAPAATADPLPLVRHDRVFLGAIAALAVLLRFPGLLWPLMPDESGFTLVARHWDAAADTMYGQYWVDRPPILIALFRLSDWIGGSYAPRVVSAALAAVMVVAAYRAGLVIAGRVTARWVAVACLALISQPALTMWSAKSESLGVPFTMVSCLLIVETLYRQPGRARYVAAFGAGLVGALALGMKQSLFGPELFGIVAFLLALRTRRLAGREARRVAGATAAGFAVPVLAVVGWALAAGVRLSTVWETLYGFRGDAFQVINESDMTAPLKRADELLHLFITTGMVVAVLWFVAAFPATFRAHRELAPAVAVMLVADAGALVVSGSYWTAYLLPFVTGITIALALIASTGGYRIVVSKILAGGLALSSAYAVITWGIGHTVGGEPGPTAHYTGEVVADVAAPGDSIVVLYGRADIVLESGLPNSYEQLWSLPMRTLDPDLAQMKALIAGPNAPTWVVEALPINSWDIDADGSLQALLTDRYTRLESPCGMPVWLRQGVDRPGFPAIDCSAHWYAFD